MTNKTLLKLLSLGAAGLALSGCQTEVCYTTHPRAYGRYYYDPTPCVVPNVPLYTVGRPIVWAPKEHRPPMSHPMPHRHPVAPQPGRGHHR